MKIFLNIQLTQNIIVKNFLVKERIVKNNIFLNKWELRLAKLRSHLQDSLGRGL